MNKKSKDYELVRNFVFESEIELNNLFIKRSNDLYLKLQKILNIFHDEKLSTSHFSDATGMGLDDISREKIDNIYANLFQAKKAAVRMQFVSGTHAIGSVLFGILRPGDIMLSVTGNPYDTLEEVIGLRKQGQGSLIDFGIRYQQIDYRNNSIFDNQLRKIVSQTNCKLVFIQKSCGYTWRRSLNKKDIQRICKLVHSINKNCICFVDNCYGELVEDKEPTAIGANIVAGSLIKNLGGTIVPSGGYVAGDQELVELACCRLTSPGIGSKAGINFGLSRTILQGLFLSPQMIHESLNCADLIASVFKKIGFKVLPEPGAYRSDIIQAIQLEDPLLIKKICQSFQSSSPVDSFLNVIPSIMDGYESNLLMAGGTFIEGSTSEFSADAPIRKPYNIFIQGGTHIAHVKIALIQLISDLLEEKLITRDFLSSI